MFADFVQGIATLVQPEVLLFLFLGTVIATVIGVIPVLGGAVGMTLMLPFIFGLDPAIALPFLLAIHAVSYTGGSVTAILMNIPGTMPNAATCLDGYPMSQKGEGGRAIGASVIASVAGGIVTVPMALLMIPIVIPFVLMCRAPEMLFIIIMGLCFMAVLTRGSVYKGLISGALGILLASIGWQAITGVGRFTFGIPYLYDGLSVVDVVLALFALPAILELSVKQQTIAPLDARSVGDFSQLMQGARDVLQHKWLWFRSSVVGYIVGVIPGIGSFTSTFLAYGMAKQSSKNPEKFGTGCVEGVIAPESANNSKEAGSLLTTMAFGIPGSGVMAIMLAAFLMVGIQPGPSMIIQHTDLCVTMLVALAVANLMAGVMVFFGAPQIIKITRVSYVYLFVIIVPIIFLGAFVWQGALLDVFVLLILGVVGVCIKRFGFSQPALLLGFVLGSLFEYYLWHSLDAYGKLFFLTPISMVLICIIIGVLNENAIRGLFLRWRQRRREKTS